MQEVQSPVERGRSLRLRSKKERPASFFAFDSTPRDHTLIVSHKNCQLHYIFKEDVMDWLINIILMGVIAVMIFFNYGCFLLINDRYWHRVWVEVGQPPVVSIKELESLINGS